MTSGNVHDEPICIADEEARAKLAGIADAFLGNNRPILTRFDDSVVRLIQVDEVDEKPVCAIQFLRRARGYAPVPVSVTAEGVAPAEGIIFAAGPEQKNTFTLTRDTEAFVSQHIGDVENAETYDAWLARRRIALTSRSSRTMPGRAGLRPAPRVPHKSKWAHDQSQRARPPAHRGAAPPCPHRVGDGRARAARCRRLRHRLRRHGLRGRRRHLGRRGAARQPASAFERFANFAYVPLPGGAAAAIKHPLRMAYGALWAYDLLEHPAAAADALASSGRCRPTCASTMIDRGLNTPMTSSVGRLFDAASALLGVCTNPLLRGRARHPAGGRDGNRRGRRGRRCGWRRGRGRGRRGRAGGEGALRRRRRQEHRHGETSTAQDTSVAAPRCRAHLPRAARRPGGRRARARHQRAASTTPSLQRRRHERPSWRAAVYGIATVALSGGVFMNRYLVEHALAALEPLLGFTVAVNRDLPPNDGCISLRPSRGGIRSFGRSRAPLEAAPTSVRREPADNGALRRNLNRRHAAYVLGHTREGRRALEDGNLATVDILGVTRDIAVDLTPQARRGRLRARARRLRHRGGGRRTTP